MKQRFTLLDLKATINELSDRLTGLFIQNFTSIQQRFIFIKFSNKETLLIEPGYRMHLTQTGGSEISHFCKKLREKCRRARIHRIFQYGFDRIAVLDIKRFRIVIEFFSAGNVIIIDDQDCIVEILRPVPELGMTRGSKYVFNCVDADTSFDRFMTEEDMSSYLQFDKEYLSIFEKRLEKKYGDSIAALKNEKYRREVEEDLKGLREEVENIGFFGEVLMSRGKPVELLCYKTVEDAFEVKSELLSHSASDQVNETAKEELDETANEEVNENANEQASETANEKLDETQDNTENEEITDALLNTKITARKQPKIKSKEEIDQEIPNIQKIKAIHFQSFNQAAEYFFSDLKKQKTVKEDKGTRIRKAQERYIEELENVAEGNKDTAEVLEENKELVGAVLEIFNKVFRTKMEWKAFEVFWEDEKQKGNPHASAIVSFDLDSKKCVVQIKDRYIELDLAKTLNKNIESYYLKRRKAIDKGEKTKIALENIVEKMAPKKTVFPAQKRENYWFEKFHFFISTENELVIGGKNAEQNEIVVKKHMDLTDLYFHCEVHGASSVICKGRKDATVQEAAVMSLCMSKCWDERVVRGVFSVEPEQVSKTAPTGEFVQKGSFMIRGKKNLFNPYRLEYGIGVLFKLEGVQETLRFTPNPGEADKIAHAIPVAAPWITVKDYKYKVRIVPGVEKKSKLCQDIKARIDEQAEGSAEEKAVKSIGENEYMNVVPGKSRIALSSSK